MSRTLFGVGLPDRDRRADSATDGNTVAAGMIPISLSMARRLHHIVLRGVEHPRLQDASCGAELVEDRGGSAEGIDQGSLGHRGGWGVR
jgi:hypothetical protein